MQHRTLGRTGVQVSTLALGEMNVGAADRYGQGESEEMVGTAIAGRRDDLVMVDTSPALLDPTLRRR
jgi:aryl-alcohol dehydrogenase-like predicted oxidoreductase